MFAELSSTINKVVKFTNKHYIDADFHINEVGALKGEQGTPDHLWAKFEKAAGVYMLFNTEDSKIHYIGMSEKDVGTRLDQWLFKKNKVNDVLNNNDLVLTISLKKQSDMSPALE
jgi:hypothetical protein